MKKIDILENTSAPVPMPAQTTFEGLGVSERLLKVLATMGIVSPTEVQEQFLRYLGSCDSSLQDIVVQAQTGTGKTFAYAIPLLDTLEAKFAVAKQEAKTRYVPPSCLILVPTRELAVQVQTEVEKLVKATPNQRAVAIYGGASYERQISQLRSVHPCAASIVVGTPGRVKDMMDKKLLKLEAIHTVILDEADEMLNMGFWDDVQYILSSTPSYPDRQTWLFSATMPRPIQNIINTHFHQPKSIQVKKKTMTNADVEEQYFVVKRQHRTEALYRLIESVPEMYGLVFCKTKIETQKIAEEMLSRGVKIDVLNGDLSQSQREIVMEGFKKKRISLLACTDVAARGIDVKNLTHVINIGMSQDNESYVHRIGRTGRAGMKGMALTLIEPMETFKIKRLEQFTRRPIIRSRIPRIDEIKNVMIEKELNAMEPMLTKIKEKGSDFKVDETFSLFAEKFSDVEKTEVLKLLFSSCFNKKFKKLSERDIF